MSDFDGQQMHLPWAPGPAALRRSAALWTSLERAPTLAEAQELVRRRVQIADFTLQDATPEVMQTLRRAGIKIFAYNIGNGGGYEHWREPTGLLEGPGAAQRIYTQTREALLRGADGIHLDNPDKLSERQLEALMDAQVRAARSLGREPALHLKNAADVYANILSRRPDLRPYVQVAVVEELMAHADQGRRLAAMGIPVFGVEFQTSHIRSTVQRSVTQAQAFFRDNDWVSGMISMPQERHYDCRPPAVSLMRRPPLNPAPAAPSAPPAQATQTAQATPPVQVIPPPRPERPIPNPGQTP